MPQCLNVKISVVTISESNSVDYNGSKRSLRVARVPHRDRRHFCATILRQYTGSSSLTD